MSQLTLGRSSGAVWVIRDRLGRCFDDVCDCLGRRFGWSLTTLTGVSRRSHARSCQCVFVTLGLCASDMRVRMLVRASMYASSCMCGVGRMCAWFSACFRVLALTCMLTPTFVFAPVFVYVLLYVCFVQDCVCVSA